MQEIRERGYTWPARIALVLLILAQGLVLTGLALALFRTGT
jgi:hypothetical protein